MHLDILHSADPRRYPARINAALNWLRAHDPISLTAGRYDIDPAMRAEKFNLTTRLRETLAPEVHRDHIDIHYLINGRETIACRVDDGSLIAIEPYDNARDVAFYSPTLSGESLLNLAPGDFAILYPGEIHRPGCGTDDTIDKIVIKIRLDSL